MSSAERHNQIKQLFSDAADLPSEEREPFLAAQCAGDASLREAVDALLRSDEQTVAGVLREPLYRLEHAALTAPQSAAMSEESFPDRIGRYHLLRKIGEGGMGIVFEAQQENPSRKVALKLIRPGFASAQVLRRFEREAQILGQLQHPGIAQIYEAGAETVSWPAARDTQNAAAAMEKAPGGSIAARCSYFAMELISGQSLADYCRSRRLSVRDRLEITARICEAVQFAHSKGIIHRDLKPANILVDSLGQPKILDFGVARAIEPLSQANSLQTDVGQIIGTLPYMSPELITGDPARVDSRCDVYELGVILYELLAGRTPHDLRAQSLAEAVRIIREEEPTRLSSIDRTLRGDIETIVSKALEKEKHRRYQSAAALAQDIRRFLGDEPIQARPASAMYQLRKFSRRNRGLVGGILATFIVLMIGAATATALAVRASAREALAQRQTYRASLAAAAAALRSKDLRAATDSLHLAPINLRGWEWRFLEFLAAGSMNVLRRDARTLSGIAASRDGSLIAALESGGVRVWDAARGLRLSVEPADSADRIVHLAISGDGSRLATVSDGGRLSMANVATAETLWRREAAGPVLAFSPDDRLLATTDRAARAAILLDSASGQVQHRIELRQRARATGFAFSPVGELLAVTDSAAHRDFYEIASGRLTASIVSWISAMNHDWSRIVHRAQDDLVLLTFPALQPISRARVALGDVRHLAFLPEDIGVTAYAAPGSAHVLDNSLREVMQYSIPADAIGFQRSPQSRRLLTATRNGVVLQGDPLATPLPYYVPQPSRFPTLCAAVSPDARLVVVAGWGDVRLYDATTGELRWCAWPEREWITSVAFSPGGEKIAAGGGRGIGWIVDVATGAIQSRFETGNDSILSVCWIDNRRIATGGGGGNLIIVDCANPESHRLVNAHRSPIHTLCLSPDGATLVSGAGDDVELGTLPPSSSGANDATAKFWNTADWTNRETRAGKHGAITYAVYSADGNLFAAAGLDGTVDVWNRESQHVAMLSGAGICRAMAFHPLEPRLIAWSLDGAVRIWDTSRWEEVVTLHTEAAGACAARFSTDGCTLAGSGRSLPVFLLETGENPESTDQRFFQRMAATQLKVHDGLLTSEAIARIQTDPLIPQPVREAAVRELTRRGDHLNWLISDAIMILRDPAAAASDESLVTVESRIQAAIAIKSDEPGPWTLLGEVHHRRHDYSAAAIALRQAVACHEQRGEPPSISALSWLARSLHVLGELEPARAALRQGREELSRRRAPTPAERDAIAEAARLLGDE